MTSDHSWVKAMSFLVIPDDLGNIEEAVQPLLPSKLEEDITTLETGAFSDCAVTSRDVTWKTHKVILNRCPYFSRAFRSSSGFKESLESKITIENFEPFEVSWLLRYIYGLRKHIMRPGQHPECLRAAENDILRFTNNKLGAEIDIQCAQETSPNKSLLETCVLLWGIGDFFQLPDLSESAVGRLQNHSKALFQHSRFASTMLENIKFLPDLEAGIRAAWRQDRAVGPFRRDLISVCVGIHPFVKDHASFISLLDEIPEFTAQYVKALLGCPGMQRIDCNLGRCLAICKRPDCSQQLFDHRGNQVSDEVVVWAPTCLHFWENSPLWFCSEGCYNYTVARWGYDTWSSAASNEDHCTKQRVQHLKD